MRSARKSKAQKWVADNTVLNRNHKLILMIEIWKDIRGYEGLYQCSSYGNVRSLTRTIIRKTGVAEHKNGTILTPAKK